MTEDEAEDEFGAVGETAVDLRKGTDKHDYFYCKAGFNEEYAATFLEMHIFALRKAGRHVVDTIRRGDVYRIKVMKIKKVN